jgi:hypothetical protein
MNEGSIAAGRVMVKARGHIAFGQPSSAVAPLKYNAW